MAVIVEIEKEFLNRATDRANRLIAKSFLYANFVCGFFIIARYLDFFGMSYSFTLTSWSVVAFFTIILNAFIYTRFNRTLTMYLGLAGVIVIISLLGTNSRIGIYITYAMATLFSCLYLVKRYTLIASSMGYLGMVISLFFKSRTMYLIDTTSDTPMAYFVPVLAGFTIEYVLLLITCVSITGIIRKTVLDLQKKNERIRILQSKEIQTFANIVECRDKFSGEHIKRTSSYVQIISEELAKKDKFKSILTNEVIQLIVEAAPLHDLGKIQIPDYILKKPGKLTEEEFSVMKTHSEAGYNMIEKYLTDIVDHELLMYAEMMSLYHHERYDGTGYPRGIEGETIPLCARIMTVADVFDALMSKRQYKDSFSLEKAVEIMKEGSGTMFDPEIIECFLAALPKICAI